MFGVTLSALPRKAKWLATLALTSFALNHLFAVALVWQVTTQVDAGAKEHFSYKSLPVLLRMAHQHAFGHGVMYFVTGGIFLFADAPEWIALVLFTMAFVGSVVRHRGVVPAQVSLGALGAAVGGERRRLRARVHGHDAHLPHPDVAAPEDLVTRQLLLAALFLSPALARARTRRPRPLRPTPPGSFVGPERCAECHKPQFEVWKASKHSLSFKTVHREATAPDILVAAGGDRSMKKNATCLKCHYTPAPGAAGGEVVAGVSCEHCHGAASGWIKVHQEDGQARSEAETPEHKAARLAAAARAGMVYPRDLYALATRCIECHGLMKPGVDGATLAKMVHAGHPMNDKYEARALLAGHRPASLLSAAPRRQRRDDAGGAGAPVGARPGRQARGGPGRDVSRQDPAYRKIQESQAEAARAELARVKDVPEAVAFVAHPGPEAGHALAEAIAGKDLTPQVKDRLPKSKAEYR